ncbi:hypothetical protein [Belnapia moabensis]|uniref:hypothetical protein n=1 Tax=Belnapia moabensis TaxID=365533 RepID=UPI0012ECCDA2|nr:hypothetical protein [Belnapia moabensis]
MDSRIEAAEAGMASSQPTDMRTGLGSLVGARHVCFSVPHLELGGVVRGLGRVNGGTAWHLAKVDHRQSTQLAVLK